MSVDGMFFWVDFISKTQHPCAENTLAHCHRARWRLIIGVFSPFDLRLRDARSIHTNVLRVASNRVTPLSSETAAPSHVCTYSSTNFFWTNPPRSYRVRYARPSRKTVVSKCSQAITIASKYCPLLHLRLDSDQPVISHSGSTNAPCLLRKYVNPVGK